MRICIDLDGTLCDYKSVQGSYADVLPLPGAVDFVRKLKDEGHTIIIQTARHMKSCNGNVGLVIAKQGLTLHEWLKNHGIPFDELYFGKPNADIYIDDNALRFNGNWYETELHLPKSSAENAGLINIVITMAGAGSRFSKAGYVLPKPLIPAFGEPMYRHSVRSLPLTLAKKLIFIILKNEFAEQLKKDINEQFGDYNPNVIEIDSLTRGQAETVLFAKDAISFNSPILIHNADSAYIEDQNYRLIDIYKSVDGALMVFDSDEAKYSFAAVNESGMVTEVREKKVISRHASTGTYYFKSPILLFKLIEEAVEKNDREGGEFYLAPLYNKMIELSQVVKVIPVSEFICFGTPEELGACELNHTFESSLRELRNDLHAE